MGAEFAAVRCATPSASLNVCQKLKFGSTAIRFMANPYERMTAVARQRQASTSTDRQPRSPPSESERNAERCLMQRRPNQSIVMVVAKQRRILPRPSNVGS
jgi:hypothetical protein